MTKLLLPAPPNEYVKAISYPQRNIDSVFSTLLELKEMMELLAGLRTKAIGRAALWEELSVETNRLQILINALEAEIAALPPNPDPASTTEVLTGTNAAKYVTPDALAALWERGADVVPVGGVVTLGEGGYFLITGAGGTITDIVFATPKNGREATILWGGSSTSLVNSATLILPGGVNTTMAPGDQFKVVQTGATTCRVHSITKFSGTVPASALASTTEVLTGTDAAKAVTPDALAALWEDPGGTVAPSGGVLTLGDGGMFNISAGGTVSSIAYTTDKAGRRALVRVITNAVTLVHSAALDVPGNADTTVNNGDTFEVVSRGSGNYKIVAIHRDDGTTAVKATTTEVLTGTDTNKPVTPDALAALWEKGSDVAAATSMSLGEGGFFVVTGTGVSISTITFATAKNGRRALLYFNNANTLVHGGGTGLMLPGSQNMAVAPGDIVEVFCHGAGTPLYAASMFRKATAGLSAEALASTTEVLTGTDTAKAVTPDALAALWEQNGTNVASAASIQLDEGGGFVITGTTDISAITFGTARNGRRAFLYCSGTFNIIHSANLVCPGSIDIPCSSGDILEVIQTSSTIRRVQKIHSITPMYRLITVNKYSASATWSRNAKTKAVHWKVQGAGGGSGGAQGAASSNSMTGGGGAGGYTEHWELNPPSSYSITIGAGGAAGTGSTATNGGTGGDTSVGSLLVADGGAGSAGMAATTFSVALIVDGAAGGGVTTGGNLRQSIGGAGGWAGMFTGSARVSGDGGASVVSPGPRGDGTSSGGTAGGGANGVHGSGASGAIAGSSSAHRNGGTGGTGWVEAWEYGI